MADQSRNKCSFEPAELAEMSSAFDNICKLLRADIDDSTLLEAIAARVVCLARSGTHDAATMRDRFLYETNAGAFFIAIAAAQSGDRKDLG